MTEQRLKKYWKKNLNYLYSLLGVWFFASFGFGIIFRKHLDALSFGGFKLGFWFAQNGAIFAFIALIFIYVRLMNSLDKEYDVDE